MFDAALDLPRATERSWLEVLTSAGASPYFRPVTLLLWKACYELLGRNDFTVLHGLSLASHIVCGWLVYQLSRRLSGPSIGLAAAALFVLFPLSYQVVQFVDSLFHSLAALWVLAAAVLYWDARALRSPRRLAGSLAFDALALFTHEGAAALLVPAFVGLELLGRKQPRKIYAQPAASGELADTEGRPAGRAGSQRTSAHPLAESWWPALFALELVGFLAIWLAIPRWPSTPHLDLPSLKLNAAYFAQALAYPLTMLLGHLPRWGMGDVPEVLLVTALVVAALLALTAARSRSRGSTCPQDIAVSLFALAWFAAALVLPAVLLPWPNYVIDAPRLLYTASAGIALLEAVALAPRRVSRAAGALALLAILAESWAFVDIREHLLDSGAAIVDQVMVTASNGGRVYVNTPAFLGPKDADFLLGHSGVTMLPDYFGLDLEVAAATGQKLPIESLAYADLARPWSEAYGLQGQHVDLRQAAAAVAKGGGVYVTRFDDPAALHLDYAGQVVPGGAEAAPLATFGGWAAIQQAQAQLQGSKLAVRLVWRALAQAPGDYTVFIHVAGDAPQPLAQSDGYPIAGLLPPSGWPAGAQIHDERALAVPPDVAGRSLRVLVGLYDRASPTTRAHAVDGAGQPLPDDALSIPVSR
ncbi:MAG TPA: hypothetical protein VK009_14300 [Chloroflexota bacterium]|nr:hypothetical protein [Chloroflexota bacterium]